MITSCNHSENIICGSCLMKNHQEEQARKFIARRTTKTDVAVPGSVVAREVIFGNARCTQE